MKRRNVLKAALCGTAFIGAPQWARAQAYPSRQIEIIVPYGAAGANDIVARLIQPKLSAALGQPVVVDNRPGGNGNIGAAYVARSAPDGYRLLLGSNAILTLNPHLTRNLGFDPFKDLTPIGLISSGVMAIAVASTLGVSSLAELVAYVRKNPQQVFYGAPGSGSPQHLAGLLLNQVAGIDMSAVQYKGITPTITDLIGRNIQVVIATLGTLKPYSDAGRIQLLAITEPKRFEGAPTIPTVAESYPGFEASAWQGLLGPAGMPRDVVSKLNAALNGALKSDDVHAQLTQLGMPPGGGTPEVLATLARDDYERWGKIITAKNIKAE